VPQFCYVDDIGSFSSNEITVNWNSALAWVASFAADQGGEALDRGAAPATDDSAPLWIALLVAFAAAGGGVAYVLSRSRKTVSSHSDGSSHPASSSHETNATVS